MDEHEYKELFSEQLEVEAALRESRRTLATLLSNLPGMAYRCRNDAQWTMEFVSEGCAELTGYQAHDLIENRTLSYADLIHADDLQMVWGQVQETVASGRSFQLQYRITDADGQVKWVAEQGRGIFSDEGKLLFLEGFISDISEHRAAEQAVRDSEAWYRTLFEAANDAIFLMDGERIVDCNSKTLEIFGCSIDEVVGRTPADLSPAEQPDASDSLARSLEWVEAALGGESQFFEWRHLRAGGEPFDVEVNLSRVDVAGRTFLQAIVREITERKHAELALKRREAILEAVSFAAAKILKAPSWEELADEVLERFGRAADASIVYLFEGFLDGSGQPLSRQRFVWVAEHVDVPFDRPQLQSLAATETGLWRWLDTLTVGEMVHGGLADFDGAERVFLEEHGVRSVVFAPIFTGGEVWGFLGVEECREERIWTDGEVEAMRAAAEILGGAIYLDQARHAIKNRTTELEILNRVTGMLASTLDATTVIQEITDIVCERCGVDHVSVAVMDQLSEQLVFVAWSGYHAPEKEAGMAVEGPGLITKAQRDARPVWAPDVAASEDYLCGDERVRAEYAVPLMLGGDAMGVLNCESFTVGGIGAWQREVIDRLAAQAGIALRNAEIYRRLQAAESARAGSGEGER